MSWSLSKKKEPILTPILYDAIYDDVRRWCVGELSSSNLKLVDGRQNNALLNFATFDLTTLMTDKGLQHMIKLLSGAETDQTVMIRLKALVLDLYIKYGEDIIDELRKRVYVSIQNMYGITFDTENVVDVNNTFWLHPFVRKMYTELQTT